MTLEEVGIKLAEVATDIKWLVSEKKKLNGTFEKHILESDKFRRRVTRNTVWRIAHHLGFVIIFGIIGFIAYYIFK